jgi:predicted dithiol-disulfide oxidoreductase (DUF899 family)
LAAAPRVTADAVDALGRGWAMSGSHKTDDLVNDILADVCGLIVKTIALIPPERDDDRLSACAFVLDQINKAVEHIVNADRTEH